MIKNLTAVGVLAGILLFSPSSRAAKDVKRVGVQGGFAGMASEGSFAGYGGALFFGWAVTDALTLGVNATGSSNQVTKTGGRSLVLSQAAGITYALDIIQIVPYAGIYAGVYEFTGGGLGRTTLIKVGGQIAFGVDYVHSRELTFGLELRGHAFPGEFLTSPTSPTPFYGTTFLKAEYTWGWF